MDRFWVDLTRFDGHPSSGVRLRKDVRLWRGWGQTPGAAVRSLWSSRPKLFDLCQRGDRSVGQVPGDFDLTETAVREWVKQAERDADNRRDGGLTTDERRELAELRRGNWRPRDDVEIFKRATVFFAHDTRRRSTCFIEEEKAANRNVKRACELRKISRAALYQHLSGSSAHERDDAAITAEIRGVHAESGGRYGTPRVRAELARRGRRHARERVARSGHRGHGHRRHR